VNPAKRLRKRAEQGGICVTGARLQQDSYAESGKSGKTVTQANGTRRHLRNRSQAAEGAALMRLSQLFPGCNIDFSSAAH